MRRYLTLLGDIDPVVLYRRKPVEGQVLTEDSGDICVNDVGAEQ